jgi:hypothetical protein
MKATMSKFDKLTTVWLVSAFLLTAFAPSSSSGGQDNAAASAEQSDSTEPKLEELLSAYLELLANNNVDGILELYSSEPVFIPQYAPPAVGREAVRKAYEWVFATLKQWAFHGS